MQGRQSKMDSLLVTKCLFWTVIVSYLYGKNPSSGEEENSLPPVHASYGVLSPAASNITPSLRSAVYEVSQQEGKTAYNAVSTRGIDRAFVYEG